MLQYRISKYDPALRDELGRYLRKEWTEYSDVGNLVQLEDYERVESAYIHTAIKILTEQGLSTLTVRNLESRESKPSMKEGQSVTLHELKNVLRSILRGDYWAKLEADTAFIHLGWDYYMYIGTTSISENVKDFARLNGLFVEPFISPHLSEEL